MTTSDITVTLFLSRSKYSRFGFPRCLFPTWDYKRWYYTVFQILLISSAINVSLLHVGGRQRQLSVLNTCQLDLLRGGGGLRQVFGHLSMNPSASSARDTPSHSSLDAVRAVFLLSTCWRILRQKVPYFYYVCCLHCDSHRHDAYMKIKLCNCVRLSQRKILLLRKRKDFAEIYVLISFGRRLQASEHLQKDVLSNSLLTMFHSWPKYCPFSRFIKT